MLGRLYSSLEHAVKGRNNKVKVQTLLGDLSALQHFGCFLGTFILFLFFFLHKTDSSSCLKEKALHHLQKCTDLRNVTRTLCSLHPHSSSLNTWKMSQKSQTSILSCHFRDFYMERRIRFLIRNGDLFLLYFYDFCEEISPVGWRTPVQLCCFCLAFPSWSGTCWYILIIPPGFSSCFFVNFQSWSVQTFIWTVQLIQGSYPVLSINRGKKNCDFILFSFIFLSFAPGDSVVPVFRRVMCG